MKPTRIDTLKFRCKQSSIIIRALLSEIEKWPISPSVYSRQSKEFLKRQEDLQDRCKIFEVATEHVEVLEALSKGVKLAPPISLDNINANQKENNEGTSSGNQTPPEAA